MAGLLRSVSIKSRRIKVACAVVAISGCAGPPGRDTASEAATRGLPAAPEKFTAGASYSPSEVADEWLSSFEDPRLLELAQEAAGANRELKVAEANLARAAALVVQSRRSLFPQLTPRISTSLSGATDSSGSDIAFAMNLPGNWDPDLWGQLRSAWRSAGSQFVATRFDVLRREDVVVAQTTAAYFNAIEASIQERLAQETVAVLVDTGRILELQYEQGFATAQDLALAQGGLASAEETVLAASSGKRQAIRALEVLTGRYPTGAMALPDALFEPPPPPPVGLPSQLLSRRPDLRAAEAQVASALINQRIAQTSFLPSLPLTGSLGSSSNSLSRLVALGAAGWSLDAGLVLPLLDGGQRQAELKLSEAAASQSIAEYQRAVLAAFEEVETSLDQGVVLKARFDLLVRAVEREQRAFALARLRYEQGSIDLLDLLSIQQRVFSAESRLAFVHRQLLEQRVALYLALGGSWGEQALVSVTGLVDPD